MPTDLTILADKHNTDKGTRGHLYTEFYERYVAPIRQTATKVLEIGACDGASLRMWAEWFPNAEIVGVDNDLRQSAGGERITLIEGDQSDGAFLETLAERGPWDFIIDDGSHIVAHQLLTFDALFFSLKPGGVYICEDIQTQFWPGYGRSGQHDTFDMFAEVALAVQGRGKGLFSVFTDEETAQLSAIERETEFVHFWRYCVIVGRR